MPKPTNKLPKARFRAGHYLTHPDRGTLYWAEIPSRTQKRARSLARFFNLTEEERVEKLAKAINGPYLEWRPRKKGELYGDSARACIKAMES